MNTGDWITFPCIQIRQPIGEFYVGVMDCKDVIEISFSDIIRIDEDRREIETVSGLERPRSKSRVKELKEYVKSIDATFPTGIILAVGSEDAIYDPESHTMKIKKWREVAKVIDGQHRIEGLRGYVGPQFELNVTLFIDMDTEDQALVFSTINLKQAPVSKSITYQLFEYARSRSPQKTCHSIARALNAGQGSPFKDKLMILGVAHDREKETLTQAAFIEPLLRLITRKDMSMKDRDTLKRRRSLPLPTDGEIHANKWVFRRWFIQNEDTKIAQTMINYFTAVSQRWPNAWKEKTAGLILNRTTGYNTLMSLLPLLLFDLGLDQVHSTDEFFERYFKKIELDDQDFNPARFLPGSSGQSQLLTKMKRDIRISDNAPWSRHVKQDSDRR